MLTLCSPSLISSSMGVQLDSWKWKIRGGILNGMVLGVIIPKSGRTPMTTLRKNLILQMQMTVSSLFHLRTICPISQPLQSLIRLIRKSTDTTLYSVITMTIRTISTALILSRLSTWPKKHSHSSSHSQVIACLARIPRCGARKTNSFQANSISSWLLRMANV